MLKKERETQSSLRIISYYDWSHLYSIIIEFQTNKHAINRLSEFGDFVGDVGSTNGQSSINNKEEGGRGVEDELNELIDLMTLAEETRLSEQMRELEQLEAEKRQRMAPSNTALTATSAKEKEKQVPSTASGLFSFMKKSTTAESSPKQDLFEIMGAAGGAASGSQSSSGLGGLANLRSINELFSNANDEFEREWQSVFGGHHAASHPTTTTSNNQPPHDGTISPTNTEFSLFSSANEQPSNELGLFPSGNAAADKKPVANSAESKPSQTKQSGNKVFISTILFDINRIIKTKF